jgi:hypothetical protein
LSDTGDNKQFKFPAQTGINLKKTSKKAFGGASKTGGGFGGKPNNCNFF